MELEVDLAEVDGEEEQQRTETEKKQEQKKMILPAKTVITNYCKGCKFGYQGRPLSATSRDRPFFTNSTAKSTTLNGSH